MFLILHKALKLNSTNTKKNIAVKFTYRQVIIILACLFTSFNIQAQEKPQRDKDQVRVDSIKIYKIIKDFSLKNKVTYWIYKFVFIDPDSTMQIKAGKRNKSKPNSNAKYAGKFIREVEIITLDPFGITVYDTAAPVKFFHKAGNKLHIKSTRTNIRNQVLFDKNDKLDLLKINESERILRIAPYIRDATIVIRPLKNNKDSVDVIIIIQDRWSIAGSASANTSVSQINILENNFLGLAHNLENNVSYNIKNTSSLSINGSYSVQNIKKTFISGRGFYNFTPNVNYTGISLNRQFYSPLTKWAGEIDIMRYNSGNFNDLIPASAQTQLQYDQQDYWIGKSFSVISENNKIDRRIAKILINARVFNIHYNKRPIIDTINAYKHSTIFLGSAGFSARKYYKDKYIFRFGEVEDVPEGRLFALLGGLEKNEMHLRYYTGMKSAIGNRIENIGYFSAALQYGTFLVNKEAKKGVMNIDLNFFSELWNIEKWKIRSFIHFSYIHGINREPYEYINLNNPSEMYGFHSPVLNGTDKMLVNLESIMYIPYSIIGFQFATVLFAGLGMIGDKQNPLMNSNLYQSYGVGILIRNEHLVINTFRISFAFYPRISGLEHQSLKYNPVSSYNLRFQDFFLSKPAIINYY